ncbi:hypothetical protein Syn7502_02496 [Synechococcus sp. PCC 7502]|uniref:hypothetical protein n=1 Tax=Synechococcus sp. PCC 7502 TaxID=1173263 RepID=UPI00029F89D7|nr:hypothetical protein [Synechococcus sp. PCC 7502]AFY74472.1 hypothetical protein Syn7502_02496 [Synechococcus sp. PCC 7502]
MHTNPSDPLIFRISPLVRITLISLYISLTIPLPFLAQVTSTPVSPIFLIVGAVIGLIALYAVLSEQVILDDQGIKVIYPSWVIGWWQGWSITWSEVKALKPRTTGQGGLVYYFLSNDDKGYLLPMRVAGFSRLVAAVQAKTGIDTTDVRPLAQPWMYLILLVFTFFLLLVDGWTIFTAISMDTINLG